MKDTTFHNGSEQNDEQSEREHVDSQRMQDNKPIEDISNEIRDETGHLFNDFLLVRDGNDGRKEDEHKIGETERPHTDIHPEENTKEEPPLSNEGSGQPPNHPPLVAGGFEEPDDNEDIPIIAITPETPNVSGPSTIRRIMQKMNVIYTKIEEFVDLKGVPFKEKAKRVVFLPLKTTFHLTAFGLRQADTKIIALRKLEEKEPKIAHAVRSIEGGAIGVGASMGAVTSSVVENAIVAGGGSIASWPVAGVSTVPVLGPFAWLLLRKSYAKEIHGKECDAAFKEALKKVTWDGDHEDDQLESEMLKALKSYLDHPYGKLMDTTDEQKVILALHAAEAVKLAEVPYLPNHEAYAKYCFEKFAHMCEKAAKGEHISSIRPEERKALEQFNVRNLPLEQREARRHQLLQVSAAYGRLLMNYMRDKRESEVTGAVLSSAATTAYMTANPFTAIPAALFLGGRWLYRRSQKSMEHLEIMPNGALMGKDGKPVSAPETMKVKGGALYRPELLRDYRDENQLSESEKKWLPMISVSHTILEGKTFKSVDELALACAPHVQTVLGRRPIPGAKVDEHKKAIAEERFDELMKKRDKKIELYREEYQEEKVKLDRLHKELNDANADLRNLRRDRMKADPNNQKLSDAIDNEITELTLKITNLSDQYKNQEKETSDRRKDWRREYDAEEPEDSPLSKARKARDDARHPEASKKEMGVEAVGENPEIQKAFTVKMHQLFKSLQEAQKHSIPSNIGEKIVAGFKSEGVKKFAIGSAKAATLAGVYAGGLSALVEVLPGAARFIPVSWAAIGGAGFGLFQYIRNRILRT